MDWRFFKEPNSLWRSLIKQKYKYPEYFTMSDISRMARGGPWKAICNHLVKNPDSQSLLLNGTRMKIGNEEGTLFWYHTWVTDKPLKTQFPRLFALSALPLASVAAMGFWMDGVWTWDPPGHEISGSETPVNGTPSLHF